MKLLKNITFPVVFIVICSLFVNLVPGVSAKNPGRKKIDIVSAKLVKEPLIRIGLSTNSRSIVLTTSDFSLTALSDDGKLQMLDSSKVSVSARAYRPPVIENYQLELTGIATKEEAEQTAKDVREATEQKTVVVADEKTPTWRVQIGDKQDTKLEATDLKDTLAEKGFEDVAIQTERIVLPSDDAIEASKNKNTNANAKVGSLVQVTPANSSINANLVKPTGLSSLSDTALDPNLRELIVSGGSATSKFTSFKPMAFGSTNERNVPVKLNGKAYRGRIEVFVNERGSLTVVNLLSMEDYVRGVVPNELSLPALEAQKAQAVAARTYAMGNLGQFKNEGFDLLPTTRSQVYRGFSSETSMGSQATSETSGIVATYQGKPINAMYTSTCGGRTENVENIYPFSQPYLRGRECRVEGHAHFDPITIRTTREPASVTDENSLNLVRETAILSISGFPVNTNRYTDSWFESAPTKTELQTWFAPIASRLRPPTPIIPTVTAPSVSTLPSLSPTPTPLPTPIPTPLPLYPSDAKPTSVANFLAAYLYGASYADTLLSSADLDYLLSFEDGKEISGISRPNTAILIRDGWLSLYADAKLHPNELMNRAKILHLLYRLATKKNWLISFQNGTAKSGLDGKLVLKSGKGEKTLAVRPDVFLFRAFGEQLFQVRETALVGGEPVNFYTNGAGEVAYLEVRPTTSVTTSERTSQFTSWNVNLSPSAVQSRLVRYVRGFGTLLDVNISKQGVSRRAIELEIIGTNGVFKLAGGKIRSALRLKEQLFVLNKRYDTNGRATAYNFTGRGWGHGIGMCQVGAYGMAKNGLKYDKILKNYYTGIDLTKMY